ncbi:IclR family transcriptional regulator [Nocardioides gansuensis]|uniref:IclR family transcriptional regulator n=1 Tax=Nocardioides gansuensis TaxID=2138300 RepID=UPI003CCC0F18
MACGIPTAAPGSPNRHVPSPLGLPWTDRVEEAVRRIARQTGESAFFSVKRGNETVCLLREDGNFPIRSHVLYEGVRFPLGAASAGLAILAHLSERERETYLAERTLTHAYGAEHAPGPLRERIAETRRSGFALNPGQIVEGIWGMASAVFDGSGDPRWALSINGIEARFPEARRAAIVNALSAQWARFVAGTVLDART